MPSAIQIRTIAQFTRDIDNSVSYEAAVDVLHEAMEALGFSKLVYGWSRSPRDPAGYWRFIPLTVRNLPSRWNQDWQRHSAHDPHLHHCYLNGDTDWNMIHDQSHDLSVAERACLAYKLDLGLVQGLTLPVARAGRFAFLTALCDPMMQQDWSAIVHQGAPMLKLLASYFDQAAMSHVHMASRSERLSPRELECLAWSARGKTLDEVATIISISPETVRVYFKRINIKLNTTNRVHAIARAVSLGLIGVD